jgi:radical SAM protein with 4Fe4S-binding SPASM domain
VTESANRYIPSQVSIETVLGCNARCVMCSVHEWVRPHGMMTDAVFELALSQLSDLKNDLNYVGLFLDGEPLIDRFLEHRIARCKAVGLRNVGFTSNASLLSEDRAQTILESRRLKYDRVLANIKNFISRRDQTGAPTRIILRHIEHAGNRGEFDSYRAYFSTLLDNDRDEMSRSSVHNFAMGGSSATGLGSTPCGYLDNRVVIFVDGQVPLCCVDYNGRQSMGNIQQQHILEIFNSQKWNQYREIHAQGRRNTIDVCNGCDVPELEAQEKLHVKMTPSGEVYHSRILDSFDYDSERKLVQPGRG